MAPALTSNTLSLVWHGYISESSLTSACKVSFTDWGTGMCSKAKATEFVRIWTASIRWVVGLGRGEQPREVRCNQRSRLGPWIRQLTPSSNMTEKAGWAQATFHFGSSLAMAKTSSYSLPKADIMKSTRYRIYWSSPRIPDAVLCIFLCPLPSCFVTVTVHAGEVLFDLSLL